MASEPVGKLALHGHSHVGYNRNHRIAHIRQRLTEGYLHLHWLSIGEMADYHDFGGLFRQINGHFAYTPNRKQQDTSKK
jgi:hypothetical protein